MSFVALSVLRFSGEARSDGAEPRRDDGPVPRERVEPLEGGLSVVEGVEDITRVDVGLDDHQRHGTVRLDEKTTLLVESSRADDDLLGLATSVTHDEHVGNGDEDGEADDDEAHAANGDDEHIVALTTSEQADFVGHQ